MAQPVYVYPAGNADSEFHFRTWLEGASVIELYDMLLRYNKLQQSYLYKARTTFSYSHYMAKARLYLSRAQAIKIVIALRLGQIRFVDGAPEFPN
jgi:hypothetical protein